MSRLDHYERKRQFVVSLPPTVARWLTVYGSANLSIGILEAVRQLADVDALYPAYIKEHYPRVSRVNGGHRERCAAASNEADWSENQPRHDFEHQPPADRIAALEAVPLPPPPETREEYQARIRQRIIDSGLGADDGQKELRRLKAARRLAEVIEEGIAESQRAFDEGLPLPTHEALDYGPAALRRARQAILERCKELFGWESGQRPVTLRSPVDQRKERAPDVFDEPAPSGTSESTFDLFNHSGPSKIFPARPCWRCGVGVLMTEIECPDCGAVNPLPQPEPAVRAAVVQTQDAAARVGTDGAVRACWNCDVSLPLTIPAPELCPECGADEPLGDGKPRAAEPQHEVRVVDEAFIPTPGAGTFAQQVAALLHEPDSPDIDTASGTVEITGEEPGMTKPPHAPPEDDFSEPSF